MAYTMTNFTCHDGISITPQTARATTTRIAHSIQHYTTLGIEFYHHIMSK